MTTLPHTSAAQVDTAIGIVGLGLHGQGIAELAAQQGFLLRGAVDVGEKVGRPMRNFVSLAPLDALVHDSIDALIDLGVDLLVLTAAVPVETLLEQANRALARGVNVLTIHSDVFAYDAQWADALDRMARAHGASFLSTGVQDTWWVQMPALAAGSTVNLRAIELHHVVDVNSLSAEVGRMIGVGLTPAKFAEQFAGADPEERPVLGDPLREAARKLGLTVPSEVETTMEPVVADAEVAWTSAGRTLTAGEVIGSVELTAFTTAEGVRFSSSLRTVVLDAGTRPSDEVVIDADPALRLVHSPFPGDQITNVAAVNRIRDVIEAEPGVLSAATLPPARYATMP